MRVTSMTSTRITGRVAKFLAMACLAVICLASAEAPAGAATTSTTWARTVGAANSCSDIFGAEVTGFGVTALAAGNGTKVTSVTSVQPSWYTAPFWSITSHTTSVTWNSSHSEAYVNATAIFTLTYWVLKETEQYQITLAIPANGNWSVQMDYANCIGGLTFA